MITIKDNTEISRIVDSDKMVIIIDDDAATVGAPCWFLATEDEIDQYKKDGGTVSTVLYIKINVE